MAEHTVEKGEPERIERRAEERPLVHAPRSVGPSQTPGVVPLGVDDEAVEKWRLTERQDVDDSNEESDDEGEIHDTGKRKQTVVGAFVRVAVWS